MQPLRSQTLTLRLPNWSLTDLYLHFYFKNYLNKNHIDKLEIKYLNNIEVKIKIEIKKNVFEKIKKEIEQNKKIPISKLVILKEKLI